MTDDSVIDPALSIVDSHHHLWEVPPPFGGRAERRYLASELASDIDSGHNIVATVYVECNSGYRSQEPEAMRPVGETEFALQESVRGGRRNACAGIIGFADLLLGDAVIPVLEAHIVAGLGRFKGIRYSLLRDDDPMIIDLGLPPRPLGITNSRPFRAAFMQLAKRNLVFDALVFHTQLNEISQLARSYPETTFVVEHAGGAIGVGSYAKKKDIVEQQLRTGLIELAACSNVFMKLGGQGMFLGGSPLLNLTPEPAVDEIAAEWAPIINFCIEHFGVHRCMFESNFPVDNAMCSYRRLWNVFKYITKDYSSEERQDLFSRTAAKVYTLDDI